MKYEKSAASSGVSCLAWAIGMLLAIVAAQVFWMSPNKLPMIFVVQCWLLGMIPIGVCGWLGVKMIRNGGSWEITIDRNGVNWVSPDQSIDQSFRIAFEDLERVETRVSRIGSNSPTVRYVLVTRTEGEQRLKNASGIKLHEVVAELERLGVPHERFSSRESKNAKQAERARQGAVNASTRHESPYHA